MPVRRRRVDTISGIPEDLADLISSQPETPPRDDLGNYRPESRAQPSAAAAGNPTDDDPQGVAAERDTPDGISDPGLDPDDRSERPSGREEGEAGDDLSALEDADGEERDEPDEELSPREREFKARIDALDRELELHRRGQSESRRQQALTATNITEENILPFRVSAQDMQVMAQDPERGAVMMNNMLTKFGMHVGQVLLARGMALIEADRQTRDDRERTRQSFWSENHDLVPHQATLRGYMLEVQQENPQLTEGQILREAAKRTRDHAGLERPARRRSAGGERGAEAAPARRAGIRPAQAERGGSRANGATTLSPTERDILELARL